MMICALRGTSIGYHSPHVTCASNSIEPEVFDLPRNQHRKQALAKLVTSDHAAQRIVAGKVERIEWCAAVAEAKRKVKDPVQRAADVTQAKRGSGELVEILSIVVYEG